MHLQVDTQFQKPAKFILAAELLQAGEVLDGNSPQGEGISQI